MKNLAKLTGNDVEITSLELADVLQTEHKVVLCSIRERLVPRLDASEKDDSKGLHKTVYVNEQNKEQPMYVLSGEYALFIASAYNDDVRWATTQLVQKMRQIIENQQTQLVLVRSSASKQQSEELANAMKQVKKLTKVTDDLEEIIETYETHHPGDEALVDKHKRKCDAFIAEFIRSPAAEKRYAAFEERFLKEEAQRGKH